jgi:hypothetical protein
MALTKCKECSASIADSAERCPACGYVLTHPNTRNWFEILTSLSGPLVVSVAGTVLAYMTFVHQAETQETQELQTMVESAVSNDPVKGYIWPARLSPGTKRSTILLWKKSLELRGQKQILLKTPQHCSMGLPGAFRTQIYGMLWKLPAAISRS